MNLRNELEECCVHIESNKINDRKKNCGRLSNLLENDEVLALLNEGNTVSWKQVISSVQECLKKVNVFLYISFIYYAILYGMVLGCR